MTEKTHITYLQGDRLARELPGTFGPTGEGLAGKLAVAAVLGILLAVVGDLTDARRDPAEGPRVVQPGSVEPPAIMPDGSQQGDLAVR